MNNHDRFNLAMNSHLGRDEPAHMDEVRRIMYAADGLEIKMNRFEAEAVWLWYSEGFGGATWKRMENYGSPQLVEVIKSFIKSQGIEIE